MGKVRNSSHFSTDTCFIDKYFEGGKKWLLLKRKVKQEAISSRTQGRETPYPHLDYI